MHRIDVQNLFCEVSKYTRVSHPHLGGLAGRTRIKQKFRPSGPLEQPFYPPKWGVDEALRRTIARIAQSAQGRAQLDPTNGAGRALAAV